MEKFTGDGYITDLTELTNAHAGMVVYFQADEADKEFHTIICNWYDLKVNGFPHLIAGRIRGLGEAVNVPWDPDEESPDARETPETGERFDTLQKYYDTFFHGEPPENVFYEEDELEYFIGRNRTVPVKLWELSWEGEKVHVLVNPNYNGNGK
jgi:hypothetical protein